MKILQVTESLNVGGAEKICILLTNLLNKNSIDNSLLVINDDMQMLDQVDKNVFIHELKRKSKFSFNSMLEFKKIMKEFDIIHAHMIGAYRYTSFVNLIFGLNKKIIFHDHNGDIDLNSDEEANWNIKHIFKPIYYIGVCEALCNWAKEKLMVKDKNIFLLENTVSNFNYVKSGNERTKDIILISNFRETKNIEFALSIIQKLPYSLDIFGQVNDKIYFEKLNKIIDEKGLRNKVRLISTESNIRNILPQYKLAVHTAKSESGPLTLIEYLSAQLPFVTYNTGQVVSQIKNTFPEFIASDFNEKTWAEKINHLIINTPDNSLNQKMKYFYDNNFDEKFYFNKCLNIYKQILSS